MIMEVENVRPAEAGIRLRVVGIEVDRAPHECDDCIERLTIPFPAKQHLPPAQEKVVSLRTVCWDVGNAHCFI